jgi:DNA-binding transcriptional LysR family regulator
MNLSRVDLNLLVFLDVLLRERNVTKAAEQLGITQPAMSNGLKRLRDLLDDPLLIRTSEGMTPTERAEALQPLVRNILNEVEKAVQPSTPFDPATSDRTFRVMASDYIEATLLPKVIAALAEQAPGICLDILTPSDVSFQDIEKGKVDMAINRFNQLPQSFHQTTLWRDNFACLLSASHPGVDNFDLETYLASNHVWVNKTNMGVGTGMDRDNTSRLGWIDEALAELDVKRNIRVFTRNYMVASILATQPDLIATLPRRMAQVYANDPNLAIRTPPFPLVPIEIKMIWSPLLQHNPGHQWLRRLIVDIAREE